MNFDADNDYDGHDDDGDDSDCRTMYLHGVSEKTVQNYFCQNFVKFTSIVILFGR